MRSTRIRAKYTTKQEPELIRDLPNSSPQENHLESTESHSTVPETRKKATLKPSNFTLQKIKNIIQKPKIGNVGSGRINQSFTFSSSSSS
jgi:hypothetical protein